MLVDTNVISELVRPTPDEGVLRRARQTSRLTVSVVTVEEISHGLAWRPNPRIQTWFDLKVPD